MAEEDLKEEQEPQGKNSSAGTIKLIIAGIAIIILAAGISFAVARFAAVSAPQHGSTYNTNAKIKTDNIGTTFDAGEYLTNLAGGSRYIKVKIVFSFANKELETEITNKLPAIQNTINKVLREQSADALNEPKSMDKLADRLKKNINELLVTGNIDEIYFTYFVIQ
ncbi:flagellar basal body-associated protein FliL [Thermincola ferriacetica]|uniref:Flagellar protein FliL n=1 Tax=Thermincola ferriacetica TaxID=281456 RepID=A0A0L6W5L9_9FIRM|nr:flagellar basal body-associated FliL family protein [Thermincola ferriacetica]KNZ70877.1 flagellar basal body-associated protein FliL [Thermincola ferriacetica]